MCASCLREQDIDGESVVHALAAPAGDGGVTVDVNVTCWVVPPHLSPIERFAA